MAMYRQDERQDEVNSFYLQGKKDREVDGVMTNLPPEKTVSTFLEPGEALEMKENLDAYIKGFNGETL
jgi:hypothetical protein